MFEYDLVNIISDFLHFVTQYKIYFQSFLCVKIYFQSFLFS